MVTARARASATWVLAYLLALSHWGSEGVSHRLLSHRGLGFRLAGNAWSPANQKPEQDWWPCVTDMAKEWKPMVLCICDD